MRLFSIFFSICIFAVVNFAQDVPWYDCSFTIPSSDKDFRNWARSEISWIMTDGEEKSFLALESNEEKLYFIELFWRRRDTNPDTVENEFQIDFCERVKLTTLFTSGIPGWRTDHGRIMILFGVPDKVETGKERHEWHGNFIDNTIYERWHYERVEGLGTDIVLTFIDPTETKELTLTKQDAKKLRPHFEAMRKGLSFVH